MVRSSEEIGLETRASFDLMRKSDADDTKIQYKEDAERAVDDEDTAASIKAFHMLL